MAENRNCSPFGNCQPCKEMVCIDTYRVLDSCRDKDCFEDVRVYLTGYGQEIIERTNSVRAKCAKVVWACIDIDTVPFNRGFYQLSIKIFVKIICEICVSPGNIQDVEGIAVVEKKVILFGSEGNVSVFKNDTMESGFCCHPGHTGGTASSNLPIAVLETVDPIILNARVVEPRRPCCCCCCVDEIPDSVSRWVNGELYDNNDSARLVVSLGFFSVVRIERPAQYLINALEYSVPDKECTVAEDDDPCKLFRSMAFPVNEFSPPSLSYISEPDSGHGGKCGCREGRGSD